MHKTIKKFGYPETVIKDYNSWMVLFRDGQITIGSLLLVCKENAKSFSDLSRESFLEMQKVMEDIELFLKGMLKADKINYLALMMVDKHVHFHVIPRYSKPMFINGVSYNDKDWPMPPVLSDSLNLNNKKKAALIQYFIKGYNNVK